MNENEQKQFTTSVPESWKAAPPAQRNFEPREVESSHSPESQNVFMGVIAVTVVTVICMAVAPAHFIAIILIVLSLGLYFLPILIAANRKHRNMAPIVVVNLLLGWTLVGWVVALAWAVHREKQSPPKS